MTILVAVANTHTRDEVLDVAIHFAETFGQELCVVHLVEDGTTPGDRSRIRDDLRDHVLGEDVVATVTVGSVDTTLGRAGPRFGEKLVELGAETDASHIVVGHSSKGLMGEVTQGNTAFTVADAASVPVTVVPEDEADRNRDL